MSSQSPAGPASRLRIAFRGVVQGVGFRPFIYRLATELELAGWVANSPDGAIVELEGSADRLDRFVLRVQSERPPRSAIHGLEITHLDPLGLVGFSIRPSLDGGPRIALILPDIATCDECLAEVRDPSDRRYRYPFTNCTNCGPRFSIILSLPYDRPATTMAGFAMCEACRAEYEDPLDRRFHAQPNACPVCGPHVELWNADGSTATTDFEAIAETATAVRAGRIVAVKGLGGFHLVADAANEDAVALLRQRKRRDEKPLALMCADLEAARRLCAVTPLEERALVSPERPILLMSRTAAADTLIAEGVAPANPYLGVMLPYTPLHHLLLEAIGRPIIATSGNLSDEPICIDEHEALLRLRGIADLFLVHNRPIARHVDDSVVRLLMGREQVLRRSRGFAPLPVPLPVSTDVEPVILAVGAHLKNALALTIQNSAYISQHIGDLDTEAARRAHRTAACDLCKLYEASPSVVAADMHPDYASTLGAPALAAQLSCADAASTLVPVQHHYAHIMACMAENELAGSVLGVAWDGAGLGSDGTIWGGEWLHIAGVRSLPSRTPPFRRIAHLRPFPLVGGEAAIKQPRRSALGLLWTIMGDEAQSRMAGAATGWAANEVRNLMRMAETRVNSPMTSSVGRLFDGVASLLSIHHVVRFEGQAAMSLEWAIRNDTPTRTYDLMVAERGTTLVVDWEPLVRGIIHDADHGVSVAAIARGFHDALVRVIVQIAQAVGEPKVVLTGGCFQNRYLTEQAVIELRAAGFHPYHHQRVPPNDGGIALGQAFAARRAWACAETGSDETSAAIER